MTRSSSSSVTARTTSSQGACCPRTAPRRRPCCSRRSLRRTRSQAALIRRSSRRGSSRTASRCASNSSSTKCFGPGRAAASEGDAEKLHLVRAFAFAVRFEEIDHTADVGIRAYGQSLDELFANAAEGMSSLIADLSTVKPVGEVEVRVTADDIPTLFLRWLSELLYVHETQRFLFSSFDAHVAGTALVGHARGETIDKSRHELKLAIKAVTRHGLTVDPEKGFAEVIFDI
ncbi:MAG: archease [Methanobacteriota archaeon]|nr:MAG: archease [Euryarchaeota archaeon]